MMHVTTTALQRYTDRQADQQEASASEEGRQRPRDTPQIAGNIAAGAVRAQVLPCVTGVDDADGASDSGVQAGNRVVKDHECDNKGGAHDGGGVDCASCNALLCEQVPCMQVAALLSAQLPNSPGSERQVCRPELVC